MAIWSKGRQTLHDRLADCRVVVSDEAPKEVAAGHAT
jgi:hypothetical protein